MINVMIAGSCHWEFD